jgi:hypothetical protein
MDDNQGGSWNEKGACLTAVVFLATGLTLIPEGMPLHAILERMAPPAKAATIR